jgi:hypothetical protein
MFSTVGKICFYYVIFDSEKAFIVFFQGSLEGVLAKKRNKLVSLSPQQLLDCSRLGGNDGCQGGFYQEGFKLYDLDNMKDHTNYIYFRNMKRI